MNKVKYAIILVIAMLLLTSYDMKNPKLPMDMKLLSKYVVLDEKQSPTHVLCGESTNLFMEMNRYDCSFKVENMEFDIMEKYEIDSNGKMIEYWDYKSEGPIIYTHMDIISDSSFAEYIKYKQFSVKINSNKNQIIDVLDRCDVEHIFYKEKLVLMKKNNTLKKDSKRILYQYE